MESQMVVGSKLLRCEEVARRLGISPRHVFTLARNQVLPFAVRIGKRSVRWREEEIDQYIANL
jgi:excisionase family DNA binding protein